MRFNLNLPVVNYRGQLFTRPVTGPDGQPVIENDQVKQEPLTLKHVLESACLNADPQQYATSAAKMMIFNLLMKIHKADPFVQLSSEEVSTLKELTGKQLSVAAVGAIHTLLEKPVPEDTAAS